jgi:methylenetetrahydromethanopterin reductase (EC 1.5.99.11)
MANQTFTWGMELVPDAPIAQLIERAQAAEAGGIDAAFVSSHHDNRDPVTVAALLLEATEHIRLGPGVVNPYERHPVTLASQLATLSEVAPGRVHLGIGPGDPTVLGRLGLADDRDLRSVLEAFEVARRLWDGATVDHAGRFQATDVRLNYAVDGPIPVYVGGEGPHMCRMAGKRADGLLFNGSHPADLRWAREQFDIGRQDRDPDAGDSRLHAYASVSIDGDADAARTAARPPVAFIAAGAAPPVLERHGIDGDVASEIHAALASGEHAAAFELVTPRMLDAFAIAGEPASVAARLEAVREHTDGVVLGAPLGPAPLTAIDLLAELV